MSDDALAYAKEVYAACATVGFINDNVRRLKELLDADRGTYDGIQSIALLTLAQQVQFQSIAWVEAESPPSEKG